MAYVLGAVAILLLILGWFLFGGKNDTHEPTVHRRANDAIDRAELEQAERDARDAEDEDSVRDWGPGTSPRPPHEL
jgi:hypothetical protein